MKPYYEKDGIVIYHGDALEILPTLGQVDVVLTDPPYNAKDIGKHHRKYAEGMKKMSDAEYIDWCHAWFRACNEKTDRLVFTPGIGNVCLYSQPKWMLAWSKPGSTTFSRLRGFNIWEPIMVYGSPPNRITQDLYTLTPGNFYTAEWTEHPCPKPPQLWKWLATQVTKSDDILLDPFLGSGTSLRIAKDIGLKGAIGIERVERYCEIAANRLAQEVMVL